MFARPAGRVRDARHFPLRFRSPEEMLGITALVLTVLCALAHAGSADGNGGRDMRWARGVAALQPGPSRPVLLDPQYSPDNGAGSITLALGGSSPTDVTFDGVLIAASATSGPQDPHGARN